MVCITKSLFWTICDHLGLTFGALGGWFFLSSSIESSKNSVDHTKQEQKLSYCSQKRNHAVSTGRWSFSRRQRGHDHCHGDRKHSDASKHDITEYICCLWPAAVYITRGSWGFLEFSFRVKSGTTFKCRTRGKGGFFNEVYCFKNTTLTKHICRLGAYMSQHRSVHALHALWGQTGGRWLEGGEWKSQ